MRKVWRGAVSEPSQWWDSWRILFCYWNICFSQLLKHEVTHQSCWASLEERLAAPFCSQVPSDRRVGGMALLSAASGSRHPVQQSDSLCFWLRWVFVAARGPALVAARRDSARIVVSGLLLWGTGSVVVADGLICPDQGSNLFPALAGRFSITEPPRKSRQQLFLSLFCQVPTSQ